ncbi:MULTISPECIES: iron-sulfur cluster biosynthesis family protein [Paenibacillus]|uniref:iron-sulfur cluster biosynthesis family protein n=1 Tax=Paenibacillus TaxID=44249 RepID=UPI002DB586E7|nr:iron-sulfur cluster biosynthesis family protein [Paenibacillus odorifer]MEC0133502.1 iron-sulfur cluster biosynthesis family protein [Paenibacillus odorifer]MEC0224821.1 iron-sulfur cluster biosynthesis family protein [Paenibacillus odorifer]
MHIELNALTVDKLKENLGERPGDFKLFFDTEGCGCNGVIVIQIISEPYATDIEVQKEPFIFFVDRQQESLFDEQMRLEADANYPTFKLSSDASLLGNNIRVKDIR